MTPEDRNTEVIAEARASWAIHVEEIRRRNETNALVVWKKHFGPANFDFIRPGDDYRPSHPDLDHFAMFEIEGFRVAYRQHTTIDENPWTPRSAQIPHVFDLINECEFGKKHYIAFATPVGLGKALAKADLPCPCTWERVSRDAALNEPPPHSDGDPQGRLVERGVTR